ncbi:MAG TPA: RHS repeat-associated core domain-containing protein [Thermoanaerobaculia bacterium]|nr:RHS repeat-associated core domain-containing protein [Thermoanaerobaculia bacterium]
MGSRTFSLARLRRGLMRRRGPMLALTLTVSFYSLGGEEALRAAELAHDRWQQSRRSMLLAAGVPPERLPAPEPMPLAASVQRVSGRVSEGVQLSGKWLLQRGEQLAAFVGDEIAALRADEAVPSGTARVRPATVPRPGARIRLAAEPELEDGEPARGPARARMAAASKALGSGVSGAPDAASLVPLRTVERRAKRQEVGALAPTLEASSAVAPASAPLQRIVGKSAPAPEIVALANSLGRSPGRIFRFVHDSVAYDPVWGADASPLGTLWEGRGSAWEQAWLLQELLIAAGVDARLEWGTIEITPAMLLDMTGVEDVFRAGDLLTTAGNDVVLLVQGGQVVGARLPHAWVKANLDYVPNRGATPGDGDTWVRMDPTLERFDETYGQRVDAAVPFALGSYLTSGTESSPRAVYEAALTQYATTNNLGIAGLDDLKPRRSVHAEAFPFVPGTLRAKIVSVAGESLTIPASAQQTLLLEVIGRDGASLLSWTVAWPQVWGKRVELAWPGATPADQSTLDLYGSIFATPPSEVTLRPSIRVDGVEASLGSAVGSAQDVELRATITPPHGVPTFASWPMFAGEHGVVALSFGAMPQQVVDLYVQRQSAASTPAETEGWSLARAAATYLRSFGEDVEHLGALRWQRMLVLGAAVLAVQRGAVSTSSDGTPLTFEQGPLSIDVGAMPLGLFPAQGAQVSTVPTLELVGAQGSVREGEALAAAFGGSHVTAVGFLTRAVREGQTLTRVDSTNLDAALDAAELSADAEAQIRFAVGQGLIAWISRRQIEIGGFQSTGYILENPANGAGAYLVTFERKVRLGESAVTFHAPADLAVVTAPTDVVASIEADNLTSWTLATRPVGESEATVIASGSGPLDHALLGRFDPTLQLNGMHDLVLTGTTAGGQTKTGRITVAVEGGMKIGNFTLSFVDLSVPLSGLAIEVVRTYDSRARGTSGDFGNGWWVEVRQGSYRNNRRPGEGWQIQKGLVPCQRPAETKSHLTTIRLSDREVYRFKPTLMLPAIIAGGCFAQAGFAFVDGPVPGARLEVLGSTEVFWQNGTDKVVDPESFETYEPRRVRMTTRDGRVFDLDADQGVTRLADPNGNELSIGAGGITHSSGESIAFGRDGEGRITTITDPMGKSLVYGYQNSDLTSVTDREQKTTTFTYLAGHYLQDVVDARGIRPIRNDYDADGRLSRHLDAFGKEIIYDHSIDQREEVVTDRLGHSKLLAYDERGNVVREVDALGHQTTRVFDGDDLLLSETDPLDHTTTHTYDAGHNRTSARDPLGNVTRWTYDAGGRVLTMTDARGKTTTNHYDTKGNLLDTSVPGRGTNSFTYDAQGNQLTATDALDHMTSREYDARGHVTRQVDALHHATTYTNDRNGKRLTETTTRTLPGGGSETLTTAYVYDGDGRLVETIQPGAVSTKTIYTAIGQVGETVDALGRHTAFTYDELGRQTGTAYADGTTEGRTYDAEGRLVASRDRGGRQTTFVYDASGRKTRTTFADTTFTTNGYDDAGRVASVTDARGNGTTYVYDDAGRRTRMVDALSGATDFEHDATGNQIAVTDPNRRTTRFVYDDAGRRIRIELPDATTRQTGYDVLGRRTSETDQAGKVTRFGYDELGRLVTVTDPLDEVTRYGYDEVGNRVAQTDANGHTTRFEYDALGRMTGRLLPDGAAEAMTYDAAGNLQTKRDFLGRTIGFTYDLANRLSVKTYPDTSTVSFGYTATGRRSTMVDGRGATTYTYDSRDRLAQMVYPDGRKLVYGWDANGNRTSVAAHVAGQVLTTTSTYDALNRLDVVTDPQGRAYDHGYDASGNRTSLAYPNGVQTSYTYDDLSRLRELQTRTSVGAVVQGYVYTLGAAGNRTRVDEADGTVRSYGYDALYRLTSEAATSGGTTVYTKTFGYDAVGNRLQQVHTDAAGTVTTTNGTFDDRDRQLTRGAQAWTWDQNGNLGAKVEEATYSWDFDNRLRQVTLHDGTVVTNAYDADGVRVQTVTQKPDGTATVDYLVDVSRSLSQVVAESTQVGAGASTLSAVYVRGDDLLAVARPQATAGTWTSRFYHADGLGSIRALTDETGAVSDRYAFTAFGELIAHSGQDANAYLFAGEPLDPNTGFYYNRARWMDPGTGRFASADPWLGSTYDPASLHRYLYGDANPANAIDPTGRFSAVEALVVLVILAVIVLALLAINGKLSQSESKDGNINPALPNTALNRSMHQAAMQGLDAIYPTCMQEKWEYCGPICLPQGSDKCQVGPPGPVRARLFNDCSNVPQCSGSGLETVAYYHCHPGTNPYDEYFSVPDGFSVSFHHKPYYLITPKGAVKRIDGYHPEITLRPGSSQ